MIDFLTSWLGQLRNEVQAADDSIACGNSIYGIEKKLFPYMLYIINMLLHDISYTRRFRLHSPNARLYR